MNVQIFQTPDYVVLLNEMVHNARIIPLDGSGHGTVPLWTGVSRGHWDGDTLVVETKNFLRETSFRNSSKNLHLVERIRRVDEDTLLYTFTVTDPTTWTAPWTVELPMRQSDLPIFEYACHEHNYGMINAIRGARVDPAWALDEALREAGVREGELEEKWEEFRAWEAANQEGR
jgi:hypothetical protein